jgi:hypothetical protein
MLVICLWVSQDCGWDDQEAALYLAAQTASEGGQTGSTDAGASKPSIGSSSRRSLKSIGCNWSYLACRAGHFVPIWQPLIGGQILLNCWSAGMLACLYVCPMLCVYSPARPCTSTPRPALSVLLLSLVIRRRGTKCFREFVRFAEPP